MALGSEGAMAAHSMAEERSTDQAGSQGADAGCEVAHGAEVGAVGGVGGAAVWQSANASQGARVSMAVAPGDERET
jgi:hypothetical protein